MDKRFFYRTSDPSSESYRATKINLLKPDGSLNARVHVHPSSSIDVAAIDVTEQTHNPTEHISFLAYTASYFLPFSQIKDFQTDIGDEVFALGYPLGIRSLHNDYPLAKIGYLSSLPGEEVNIPNPAENRKHQRVTAVFKGKFLVVDGLIVPGNSGGPVVLVGGIRTQRDPKTNQLQFTNRPIPNSVIGIVSCSLGGGLTVVVSSDYILDLINSVK